MPKVSVIIPTYNVEKYLVECLESVINQTLQDIEIICIDDGSTDNSGKILDEYVAKDSRIKVIHKENGGYGKAMNVGLDNATGEYIGIVEPDDYIELNMYEVLYQKASSQNAEFIKSNYFRYSTLPNIKNELFEPFEKIDFAEKAIIPIEHIITFRSGASIWTAIYKRDFLLEKQIKFSETPGASFQDTSFYIQVLLESKKAIFTQDAFYHYRIDNENSSVKNNNKIFCICDEMYFLENRYKNSSRKIKKILNTIKIDKYVWNFNRLNEIGQKEFFKKYKEELIPVLKRREHLYFIPYDILETARKDLGFRQITLRSIFSIRNSKNKQHKILTILGLKFSFRRKNYA